MKTDEAETTWAKPETAPELLKALQEASDEHLINIASNNPTELDVVKLELARRLGLRSGNERISEAIAIADYIKTHKPKSGTVVVFRSATGNRADRRQSIEFLKRLQKGFLAKLIELGIKGVLLLIMPADEQVEMLDEGTMYELGWVRRERLEEVARDASKV